MAHHKSYLFNLEERSFAAYCKALAHPARARIFNYIQEEGIVPMEQIRRIVPLATATIQDHLIRLQLAGLIEVIGDKTGQIIGFRNIEEGVKDMRAMISSFLIEGEGGG